MEGDATMRRLAIGVLLMTLGCGQSYAPEGTRTRKVADALARACEKDGTVVSFQISYHGGKFNNRVTVTCVVEE